MCGVWLRTFPPRLSSRLCCGGFNVPLSTSSVGAARAPRCGPDAALGGVGNGGIARAGGAAYGCERWVRVRDCVGVAVVSTFHSARPALELHVRPGVAQMRRWEASIMAV